MYTDSGVPKNEFKINFGSKTNSVHEIIAYFLYKIRFDLNNNFYGLS